MADELQDKALIRREPDPADRRQRNIVLTQHGSVLRARLEPSSSGGCPGSRCWTNSSGPAAAGPPCWPRTPRHPPG